MRLDTLFTELNSHLILESFESFESAPELFGALLPRIEDSRVMKEDYWFIGFVVISFAVLSFTFGHMAGKDSERERFYQKQKLAEIECRCK